MKIKQAKKEARKLARESGVAMVVTFSQYHEELTGDGCTIDPEGGYSYHPEAAQHIFAATETVVGRFFPPIFARE